MCSNSDALHIHTCTSRVRHESQSNEAGSLRSTSLAKTGEENAQQNISKARRTAYSLFASGLHGHNGIGPLRFLHLIKIHILPVLLYGLEIVQLNKGHIDQIELYQKKLIKQILSVPVNTSDTAVYILSALLPISMHNLIKIYHVHIWQETTTFFTYHVFVTWVAWVTRVAGTEIPKLAFLCLFFIFFMHFHDCSYIFCLFVINLITISTFLFEFHCIFTPGKD